MAAKVEPRLKLQPMENSPLFRRRLEAHNAAVAAAAVAAENNKRY